LGLNTGDAEDLFRKKREELGVTWPCTWSDPSVPNPIAELFQVVAYPTILVLDEEGRIRFKGARGRQLDKAVLELLAELK
jgi:hypothetical protein